MLCEHEVRQTLRAALKAKDFSGVRSLLEGYEIDFFEALLEGGDVIDSHNQWDMLRQLSYFSELQEAYFSL